MIGNIALAAVALYIMNIEAYGYSVSSYSSSPCNLYATITISNVYYNGSIRANPDGTYYPGDAFKYSIDHGYNNDPSCSNYRYWIDVRDASITGSTSGILEIDSDARGSYSLILNQSIMHTVCITVEGSSYCYTSMYTNRVAYTYRVIEPQLDVRLDKIYLYDSDGFTAVNKDGTYYINDPIGVLHNINYKFKYDRIGTLRVIIDRDMEHWITLDHDYSCDMIRCEHSISSSKYYYKDLHFGYSDGVSIYIPYDLGKGKIVYKVTLLNIDKAIGHAYASIDVEVVKYAPVYNAYAYLVLDSDGEWAYSKDIAVALHYLGSKDDYGYIHGERRSKMNANEYDAIAYMLSPNDAKEIDRGSLELKYAYADNYNKESNAVLFDKEGYGKLVFSYSIEDKALRYRYSSIVLEIRLYSRGFAGYDDLILFNVTYIYPAVRFSNLLEVVVYDADGNIKDIPVSVSLRPFNSNYLHDYLRLKVINDSRDEIFADMVVNDLYSKEDEGYGIGYVRMRVNYTSHYIPEYVVEHYGSILDIPLHIALDALTPYIMEVKVGDITKVYYEPTYSFYRDYRIVANLDEFRLVDARFNEYLELTIDKRFGEIRGMRINGSYYEPSPYCIDMQEQYICKIKIEDDSAYITVYNDWYGKASLSVVKDRNNYATRIAIDYTPAILVISITLTIFIAYRLLRVNGKG